MTTDETPSTEDRVGALIAELQAIDVRLRESETAVHQAWQRRQERALELDEERHKILLESRARDERAEARAEDAKKRADAWEDRYEERLFDSFAVAAMQGILASEYLRPVLPDPATGRVNAREYGKETAVMAWHIAAAMMKHRLETMAAAEAGETPEAPPCP